MVSIEPLCVYVSLNSIVIKYIAGAAYARTVTSRAPMILISKLHKFVNVQ